MSAPYAVPDNPSDPAAAALELIVRLPAMILHTDAFRPALQTTRASWTPKARLRASRGRNREARGSSPLGSTF